MPVYDARGNDQIYPDPVLTSISVGFPNEGFIGPVLTPSVTSTTQAAKYYIFGRETWGLDVGSDLRAPGTDAKEIPGLALSSDTFFAQEHALSIGVVDEEVQQNAAPLDPFRDGTELVTAKILLGREVAIKTMVTTASNYNASNTTTISGTNQWNDYVNSNPILDWKTGRRALHSGIFLHPTVGIIPYQVMSQLEDHPDFIERIKYSQAGVITQDIIAMLFGMNNGGIVVPGIGYNSANPGATASIGYLWGKDVLMAYVPQRPGWKIPAFAYEFVWPDGGSNQVAERWREESRKRWVVRVRRRYDLKFIYVDGSGKSLAGYLMKTAVA